MSRKTFDGRLVTHCDACGEPIGEEGFMGRAGLTEFLGLGFCGQCVEQGNADFAEALLASPLLSDAGKDAVRAWLYLQAPSDVQDLVRLLNSDPETIGRLGREGQN